MKVQHKKFGVGNVTKVDNEHIYICFDDGEREFQFPKAFESFLKTEDNELLKKIETAKKEMATKPIVKPSVIQSNPSRMQSHAKEHIFAKGNPLVGERAQNISVGSKAELFELIGYMARPGRISSIEAEVPRDGRDEVFESLFPGQKYRPIEMGITPSGMSNKLSAQFRINFNSLRNCPTVLKNNMGKGNSGCVGRINKSKFVIMLVQEYGFRFGEFQNVSAIRKIAIENGYEEAFDKGYSR